MKLTESQARSAIRKWLFEFATDSGVSHRASTDDKIAGKLGDDREDQPASTIPQETPIIATSQMSTQLTVDMPPVEDPDFIPGTVQELGRSVDLLSQQIPHEEIEWFYGKMQELADEAIEKGNSVDLSDGALDDDMNLDSSIRPSQKSSQEAAEATNENWSRWSRLLAETLGEARRNPKDPLNLKNRKLRPHDMRLYRPDEDEDDFDDSPEEGSSNTSSSSRGSTAPSPESEMRGTVIDGEYQGSYEDFLDMADEFGVDPEDLPGYERVKHTRGVSQADVMAGNMDGEQARLQQLVDSNVYPNITTVDGMSKLFQRKIDPLVHMFFVANALYSQMSQYMRSSAGLWMFFDAISVSPLFSDDNVLELKGVKQVVDAIISVDKKLSRRVPKKFKKQMATDSEALKSLVRAHSTATDPTTGMTIQELYDQYQENKATSRANLMDSGMFGEIMSELVVEPILRKWTKEVRAGNIDVSSSKNKNQLTMQDAGTWIESEVKSVWNRMGNGRKAKKVETAMTGRLEFLNAIEEARDEAEYSAMADGE